MIRLPVGLIFLWFGGTAWLLTCPNTFWNEFSKYSSPSSQQLPQLVAKFLQIWRVKRKILFGPILWGSLGTCEETWRVTTTGCWFVVLVLVDLVLVDLHRLHSHEYIVSGISYLRRIWFPGGSSDKHPPRLYVSSLPAAKCRSIHISFHVRMPSYWQSSFNN